MWKACGPWGMGGMSQREVEIINEQFQGFAMLRTVCVACVYERVHLTYCKVV